MNTDSLVTIATPVMTQEQFSAVSGLREGQVRGQISRGHLPTIYIGRLRLINLAKLAWPEMRVVMSPVMTKAAFAAACGLTEGQVESQVEAGNLATTKCGRLVLIDMGALAKRCIDETPLAAAN